MKKFILIFSLLFSISSNAQIDSLSYVAGYKFILEIIEEDFPFVKTDENIKELYRGVEENIHGFQEFTDSSAITNYAIGYMQGTFFANSLEHFSKENKPPVNCIIAGLKKVADNDLHLPQDTIEAKNYIASIPDSIKPVILPPDERCRYFTAFGLLKGLPKGLTEFANEWGINNFEPDYRHYAQGFADMLEISLPPQNPYDSGKKIAHVLQPAIINGITMDKTPDIISQDFLSGMRSAVHLEPAKLSHDEIQRISERFNSSGE